MLALLEEDPYNSLVQVTPLSPPLLCHGGRLRGTFNYDPKSYAHPPPRRLFFMSHDTQSWLTSHISSPGTPS